MIHPSLDRRSVCSSRSFSTTNAGYSKFFPFFPFHPASKLPDSSSPAFCLLPRALRSLHNSLPASDAASQHALPRGSRRGNASKLRRSDGKGVSSRVSKRCDPTSANWRNSGNGTSSTPSSPRYRLFPREREWEA